MPGKGIGHVESVVHKCLDIIPSGVIASDLGELTNGSPRNSATIGETGERLLGVRERGLQNLVK